MRYLSLPLVLCVAQAAVAASPPASGAVVICSLEKGERPGTPPHCHRNYRSETPEYPVPKECLPVRPGETRVCDEVKPK